MIGVIGINVDREHLKHVRRTGIYQVQIAIPEPLRESVAELTGKGLRTMLTKSTGIKGPPPPRDKSGKIIRPVHAKRAAMPIIAEFNAILEHAKLGRAVTVFDLRDPDRYSFYAPPHLNAHRFMRMPVSTLGLFHSVCAGHGGSNVRTQPV
jgi:hypothetical protein